MTTKLSFSAISTYTTCGYKYHLKYNKNLYGIYTHAALPFGSAIDDALNCLLITKSLPEAEKHFDRAWHFGKIHGRDNPAVALPDNVYLVYSESDFDGDLLWDTDLDLLDAQVDKHSEYNGLTLREVYAKLQEKKKKLGWKYMKIEDRQLYNSYNWFSMYRKGFIILDSYNKKIMPRIKEVLAVQKENNLQNSEGDKLVQYLDAILKWEDDRVILFDNKTSSRDYESAEASTSAQLLSYYHGSKKKFAITAIGFIVMKKGILKNKVKICSKCKHDGTGARHATCSGIINNKRCCGTWDITMSPECDIQIIINYISPFAEKFVMDSFAKANDGIKQQNWYRNMSSCRNAWGNCEFERLCWYDDSSEIVERKRK